MKTGKTPYPGRRQFVKHLIAAGLFIYQPLKTITVFRPKGIITQLSPYPVDVTIARLVEYLKSKNSTIYAMIDQQEELKRIGINIFPMKFLLFGNPKAGGVIMAEHPLAGLDLPLKILAWQNDNGQVRVAYNSPAYLAERYNLNNQLGAMLDLDQIVKAALIKS